MKNKNIINVNNNFFQLAFSLFTGVPALLISLLSCLNLSVAGPKASFSSLNHALGFGLMFFSAVMLLVFFTLHTTYKAGVLGLSVFWIIAIIFAGITVHRDFYTYFWEMIVMVYIIFLWKIDLYFQDVSRAVVRNIVTISLIFYTMISFWEVLMGYSIVTRKEPRWIECIFYNIYNTLLAQVLLIRIVTLNNKYKKRLVFRDEQLLFDDEDLKKYLFLTDVEDLFIKAFFTGNRKGNATCKDILLFLAENKDSYREKAEYCHRECIENNYTPSCCGVFKSLRVNQFTTINHKLRISGIGQIVPAGPSQKTIKENGWILKPDRDTVLDC